MTFLTKNINYSQAVYLKNKRLQPLLQSYNDFLLQQKITNNNFLLNKNINTGLSSEVLIPNNNIKYYLFVTKKNNLENTKENYNILYFFPDQLTLNSVCNNKILINTLSDFYLEINNRFDKEYLFEGYLYKTTTNKYNFLISDLLMINDQIVSFDYNMRFTILNETIMDLDLVNLNNEMSINLHPIFTRENENMIKIFKNNFIHKDDICCIEVIDNFYKIRHVDKDYGNKNTYKLIEITNQSDVYNVYDEKTNDVEGILYIKGLIESKRIKLLFLDSLSSNKIKLLCCYNKNFKKWQPVFN